MKTKADTNFIQQLDTLIAEYLGTKNRIERDDVYATPYQHALCELTNFQDWLTEDSEAKEERRKLYQELKKEFG